MSEKEAHVDIEMKVWCPQCGPRVTADEDGCCVSCGSTATGDGATAAHASEEMRQAMERTFALVADALGGDIPPGNVAALGERIAVLRSAEQRLETALSEESNHIWWFVDVQYADGTWNNEVSTLEEDMAKLEFARAKRIGKTARLRYEKRTE